MQIPKIPVRLLQKYQVKALYLFGSQAKGKTHAKSDTDIAVRFAYKTSLKDMLRLSHELSPYVTAEVDLVDLHDAPLPLQFRIFRERKLLYAQNPMEEAIRRSSALTMYFDYKYYYDRFTKFEIDRIIHHGLI